MLIALQQRIGSKWETIFVNPHYIALVTPSHRADKEKFCDVVLAVPGDVLSDVSGSAEQVATHISEMLVDYHLPPRPAEPEVG